MILSLCVILRFVTFIQINHRYDQGGSIPDAYVKVPPNSNITTNVSVSMVPIADKVLGLVYPQGLTGGFGNQVLRLMSFVKYAFDNDFKYILVDSIQFETFTKDGHRTPIPFEVLFNVDHWNSMKSLPILVHYDDFSNLTCWTKIEKHKPNNDSDNDNDNDVDNIEDSILEQAIDRGFFTPIYNKSKAIATGEDRSHFRGLDLLGEANTCEGRPTPYGSGNQGGRLWKDYVNIARRVKVKHEKFPYEVDRNILLGLKLKKRFHDISMKCSPKNTGYLSIHARMEMDMIHHKCGVNMEHNLTSLLSHIDEFISTFEEADKINFITIATSREKMESKKLGYNHFKAFADENLSVLNRYTRHKNNISDTNKINGRSVYECGEPLVNNYYKDNPNFADHGTILAMLVDFHVLVEANIFIGVRKSAFSNLIWTLRYYQGKGLYNYEYNRDGIFKIDNGGLPSPHGQC